MGRATQGVRLINLTKKNDSIASVCKVMSNQEEDVEEAELVPEDEQEELLPTDQGPDDNNNDNDDTVEIIDVADE
jgi:DNA gyrase subunit A